MGRNSLVARFVLLLQDRASAGISAIASRIQRLSGVARNVALGGALATALTFAGPIREAAAFEDALRQAAQTAGQTGAEIEETIARQARAYEALARATAQRSAAIAEAAGRLQAAGLQPELVERFLPVLSRMATGTGASLNDLAQVAIRLNQNLGIEDPDVLLGAFASMIQASRDGSVELGNMARLFPQLTAQMEALGVRGRPAVDMLGSMLQVAARGAATADAAGTNLANFLGKLTSPEAVRNFEEMGVSLPRLLADAARRGINPVEAVIQKIRELTGGDMFKVGELFGDQRVLDFLRPMLSGVQEYLRIAENARGATAGIVDQSFEDRVRGMQAQLDLAGEQVTQLGRRIGNALGEGLGRLNDMLGGVIGFLERMDRDFPGLTEALIQGAAAFLGLAAAVGALGLAIGPIAAGLGAILSPVGLLVVAVAGLAAAIYLHWGEIEAFVSGLWERVRGLLSGFAEWVTGWAQGAWAGAVGLMLAPVEAVVGAITGAIERVRAAWEAVTSRFAAGQAAQGAQPAPAPGEGQRRMGARGALGGFPTPAELGGAAASGGAGGPAQAELSGELRIVLPPGMRLESANTNAPELAVTGAEGGGGGGGGDRGRTRGRP